MANEEKKKEKKKKQTKKKGVFIWLARTLIPSVRVETSDVQAASAQFKYSV